MKKLCSRYSTYRYFSILFLPTAAIIFALLYLSYKYEQDLAIDQAYSSQQVLINSLSQQLSNEIQSSVIPELLSLAEDERVQAVLHNRLDSNLDKLAALFLALSRNHDIYDQVRFLDEQGQEIIRVNGAGDTVYRVVAENLQNKAGRYYFEDTLALDRKQVYVSQLDLNVESGEVERPFKPMIRIGTPLFDSSGNKRGILLFNYRAQVILDIIQNRGESDGQLMLVNSDGYWLKGMDPEHEWGFMFRDRSDYRFVQRFPGIWRLVHDNPEFQVLLKQGMLTSAEVDPFPSNQAVDHYSTPRWKLISWLSMPQLMQLPDQHLPLRLLIGGVFLLLALAASLALAQGIAKRNLAHARLREANRSQEALIEQLKQAQAQLVQSEKLAGIGLLAAGVAHEINNPVGFVSSNLNTFQRYSEQLLSVLDQHQALLAEADSESLKQLKQQLEEIGERNDLDFLREDISCVVNESREGLIRIQNIVADLKGFARGSDEVWDDADLHQEIERTLNLVNNEIKYHCEIHKQFEPLPRIECISSELNQVLVNLLVNAAHAITDKGNIYIRTGSNGSQVWVEIEDDGKGIDQANLDRVFDPFFTTKPVGKGTGLGLSISYGIIKKHNGTIEVRSRKGEGTCFRLMLPVKQQTEAVSDEEEAVE